MKTYGALWKSDRELERTKEKEIYERLLFGCSESIHCLRLPNEKLKPQQPKTKKRVLSKLIINKKHQKENTENIETCGVRGREEKTFHSTKNSHTHIHTKKKQALLNNSQKITRSLVVHYKVQFLVGVRQSPKQKSEAAS